MRINPIIVMRLLLRGGVKEVVRKLMKIRIVPIPARFFPESNCKWLTV